MIELKEDRDVMINAIKRLSCHGTKHAAFKEFELKLTNSLVLASVIDGAHLRYVAGSWKPMSCKADGIIIGFDPDQLIEALNELNKDIVTMTLIEEDTRIRLTTSLDDVNVKLNAGSVLWLEKPPGFVEKLKKTFTINKSSLSNALKSNKYIKDPEFTLVLNKEKRLLEIAKVCLKTDSVKVPKKSVLVTAIEPEANICTKFGLILPDYVSSCESTDIKIAGGVDFPVGIFDNSERIKVQYYLSPRIDDDEEPDEQNETENEGGN